MGYTLSWMGVLATYSTFLMPLSNSTKALHFFLWICPFGPLEKGVGVVVVLQIMFPGAAGARAAPV